MLGGLGNLGGLFKQAKEMQQNLRQMQEELSRRRYEAQAGGGLVKVTVNGRGELVALHIDPQAVADIEVLEDLVVAAANSAATQAQGAMKDEMAKLTGGLQLPGLSDLLGASGSSSTE